MPLHEDSPALCEFRQMLFSPTTSAKRGTRGLPEKSDSLAERFLSKLKKKTPNECKAIEANWNCCIPKKFIDKCAPQNARLGVLYVTVCNSSVKQEMMFCEREILKKINALDGCSKIKKIRFI